MKKTIASLIIGLMILSGCACNIDKSKYSIIEQESEKDKTESIKKNKKGVEGSKLEEWGKSFKGFHCRIEFEKDIYFMDQSINMGFRVKSIDETSKSVKLSLNGRELIEKLQIIDPEGKKIDCIRTLKPEGHSFEINEYTGFNIRDYFNINKTGKYSITAVFHSIEEGDECLKSQTVIIDIVEKGVINIAIKLKEQKIVLGRPATVEIELSTDNKKGISFLNPRLTFTLGFLWSGPDAQKELGFSSVVNLSQKPIKYNCDLFKLGWDRCTSSIWPSKPLQHFLSDNDIYTIKDKTLSIILEGLIDNKKFRVTSNIVEVEVQK